ncbi:hypothetical protein K2W90_00335 [Candidatus Babeliales bacterium]|nr:hypothetical protein [Candidatus Babeliales bacterium]
MKKMLKVLVLTACAFSCTAVASDYRSPLITDRGPLRYDFDLKKDKWSLHTWSLGHFRNAEKAFTKHSFDTESIAKMIFGKSEFTISDSFEAGIENKYFFENSNPFLSAAKIRPCVTYSERGLTVGGRFEYPVWQNKGRIGIRASVPFRTVRLERDDEAEQSPGANQLQECIVKGDAVSITDSMPTAKVFSPISRYKLALLYSLKYINNLNQVVRYLRLGTALAPAEMGASAYNNVNAANYVGTDIPFAIITSNPGGLPPRNRPTGVTTDNANPNGLFADQAGTIRLGADVSTNAQALQALPNALGALNDNGYAFQAGTDYSNLFNDPKFNTLWATQVFNSKVAPAAAPSTEGIGSRAEVDFIDGLLQQYDTNIFNWLTNNTDYLLKTNQRAGIGNADIDFFYEHTFNDDWRVELCLGVRLPTDGDNDGVANNPYSARLGNDNHVEIKFAAMAAWAALDWLNLKSDISYNFVLEATENISATFKGATVKNFGPGVDAEIDYGYFRFNLDGTFFHRKTRKLATTVGYEFYYKTEDNINFKKKTAASWLGKVWATAAGAPVEVGSGVPGTKFADYEMNLDSKVAEKDTERISHRVRLESSWHAHRYLHLYVGSAYSFAGKNIPRESDTYGGFQIRF